MNPLLIVVAVTLVVALAVALVVALLLALCSAVVAVCAWVWVSVASARYERLLRARNAADPLPPSVTYAARTWRLGRDTGDANGLYDSAQWTVEAAALPPASQPRHAAPDDDTVELGTVPATLPMPALDDTAVMAAVAP